VVVGLAVFMELCRADSAEGVTGSDAIPRSTGMELARLAFTHVKGGHLRVTPLQERACCATCLVTAGSSFDLRCIYCQAGDMLTSNDGYADMTSRSPGGTSLPSQGHQIPTPEAV
jgi:hypothetical protein